MTKTRQLAAVQKVGPGPDHMPIGEFGGAAALPGDGSPFLSAPMYWFYEMGHAALTPARAFADAGRIFYKNPANPFSHTAAGKAAAAAFELFERTTRRYSQPDWDISSHHWSAASASRCTSCPSGSGRSAGCCISSARYEHAPRRPQPKLLIVAPMSGHYATLLRGTVEAFLPNHDVYITEWVDARMVPLAEGRFDLDDYIDYVISMLHALNGDTHMVAVCQPSVPVLAAVARMEAAGRSLCAAVDDADGRPDRHARESDRREHARRRARHRVVPPPRHHQGAVPASGLHARCLSGLPAAQRLHDHEPRSPHRGASQPVPPPGGGRRRLGRRSTASSTTSISPSWTSRPSSICRRSRPCSSATTCRRAT